MREAQEGGDVVRFEACRGDLTTLAYRMLGDLGRAEDMVQDAWIRWQSRSVEPDSVRAYLITIVTRLCLNELASARARHEERRPDRLPEPIDLDAQGLNFVEQREATSMAFLVLLQRLTPAERAVLLLHDIFDFAHDEIAKLVGSSVAACRKMLQRARESLAGGRRMLHVTREEHGRLLHAFMQAATTGDVDALAEILADDVILVTDGGPRGRRIGRQRTLPRPLRGAKRVASFITATTARGLTLFETAHHELNGQPAIVFRSAEGPSAALLLLVEDGRVRRVLFHADADRLRHLGHPA